MRTILVLLILFSATLAFGQGAVLQGSATTAGHVPMYVTQGTGQVVVIDSGGAGGGGPGVGLSELSLTARGIGVPPFSGQGTGPFGTNFCDYDAPTTNPTGYHYFCLSPNGTGSNGILAVGAAGGASALPFLFNLNGTNYAFPGAFSNINIGVTGISGGTSGQCLYVNGSVVGNQSCTVLPELTIGPPTDNSNAPLTTNVTINGPPYSDPHHTFGANTFNCNMFATTKTVSCIKTLNFVGTVNFDGSTDAIHGESILQTTPAIGGLYTGATLIAVGNVEATGTALNPQGLFYGVIGQAQNQNLAGTGIGVNYARALVGVQGAPFTILASNPYSRIGVEAVDYGGAAQGTAYDIAFSASAAFNPSIGWKCAFCVSPSADRTFLYNYSPMNANATLFGTIGTGTVTTGIDISSYTFTGNEYNSTNFQITGAGAVQTKTGNLTVGSGSPAAGTNRTITIAGAASGSSGGSSACGLNGVNTIWCLGNASALLGGAFDNTVVVYASTSNALKLYSNNTLATTISTAQTLTQVGGVLSISPSVGVGYATGAGGAVTQVTNRTTGVTLNKTTGAITLFSAAGSATPASFTLTNSAIAANDVVFVSQQSGTDKYEIFVTNVGAGSCQITFFTTGGTTTEQPVFNFTVIKGAAS